MPRFSARKATRCTRYSVCALLAVGLMCLLTLTVNSATLTTIFVDGVKIDVYPVITNGVAYVPINAVAQAMRTEILWDAKMGIVKVDGQAISAKVVDDNGRILLPIEAFVTGLGGSVSYDGRHNRILVNRGPKYSNTPVNSSPTDTPKAGTVAQANPATSSGSAQSVSWNAPTPSISASWNGSTGSATVTPSSTTVAPVASYGQAPSNQGAQFGNTTQVVYGKGTAPTSYGTASYGNNGYNNNPHYTAKNTQISYNAGANPGNTGLGTQPVSTVKRSFVPPYTNNNMQTASSASMNAGVVPGAMTSTNAAVTGIAPNLGLNPIPSLSQSHNTPYVPRTASNNVFKVTVSNLETVPVIKDFYKPRSGSKFVVATLSQQNISNQVQIYTGKFSLVDQNQQSYDSLEGLSNFWLVILRPFGVNFGYLVYEVPNNSKPISLVLHSLNQAPLTINL